MAASLRIYIQGDTPIHRADARVKLVLLLLFSVGVFFVGTWRGLGVYSLAVAAVVVAGRMPLARLGALSLPLVVLLAFIWVCNAFTFDVGSLAESGIGGVSAGFAEGWQPVALAGTFGFVPQGCMFALFYAVRILLIGSIWQRLFAYRTVFIPLVVRLFRRADTLSVSMVARCYGCAQRTSLEEPYICLRQAVVFLACSALLVVVACIL